MLAAVDEGVEGAGDVIAVHLQIQREVVAGARRMLPTRRPGLRVGARGYAFASYLNDRLSRTRKPVTAPFSMVTS